MRLPIRFLLPCLLLLPVLLAGCDTPQAPSSTAATTNRAVTGSPAQTTEPLPPTPPIVETFDKEPQLSLFPRTGAQRPKDDDSEGMGYWRAFIDHIQRTSGMRPQTGRDGSNGWLIHGIKGLDSIAFFSPLAVKPNTSYAVAFDVKGNLPKGVAAGVGIVEYDRFLWISDQFTEAENREHQTAVHPGAQVRDQNDWQHREFTFTTTPRAGMIHLILFHDGPTDREKPAFFDNISIRELSGSIGR